MSDIALFLEHQFVILNSKPVRLHPVSVRYQISTSCQPGSISPNGDSIYRV